MLRHVGLRSVVQGLIIGAAVAIAGAPSPSQASEQEAAFHQLHLDLEMSSLELKRAYDEQRLKLQQFDTRPENASVNEAVRLGERNLAWLDALNAARSAEDKLRLTSPETRPQYPIDRANSYGASTIASDYQQIVSQLPEQMRVVLTGSEELPAALPVDEETYVLWARKVDRLYQFAVRWRMYQPYLSQLAARKRDDVRGFYNLRRMLSREDKLRDFSRLSPDEQALVRFSLANMCFNDGFSSEAACTRAVDDAIAANGDLNRLYTQYARASERKWNTYFEVQNARSDLQWEGEHTAVQEFTRPERSEVEAWLRENIEAEWQWRDWKLQLAFRGASFATPKVRFVPGVTPNVNGLGGNLITMDANAALDEFEVKWTIRHEFGHVLGFPDCYVEFYDQSSQLITQYQIDTTHLMCSRAGNFNQELFDMFVKHYPRR